MKILSTFLAGLLFGTGLILSGMANPAKVQNFLDLFGKWDPSLAFVMIGAIMAAMPGFCLLANYQNLYSTTLFSCPLAQILTPS